MQAEVRITETDCPRTSLAARACALLKDLLPAGVATAGLPGAADPALLLADERQLLERTAPKRAGEFAAGRLCARRAAAQFGVVNVPVGAREDRRARWPRLLTGSITHTDGFSAAAVGKRQRFRAIGIDAEHIGAVCSEIWSHVLLPAETEWLGGFPESQRVQVATLMFSAKETFYKCQYELTEQRLEFSDVSVKFVGGTLDRGSFAVRPAGRVRLFDHGDDPAIVRFAVTRPLVLTTMTLAAHR